LHTRTWRWRTWCASSPNSVPVGNFPKGATPEGVCDLVGYMDEMCFDWYDPDYYSKSPTKNPQGPSEPLQTERYRNAKVVRGGLVHYYRPSSLFMRFLRNRESGILPSGYLPTGWSREYRRNVTTSPQRPDSVDGRVGLRVVVEAEPIKSP
jgi:hypothetical protein